MRTQRGWELTPTCRPELRYEPNVAEHSVCVCTQFPWHARAALSGDDADELARMVGPR